MRTYATGLTWGEGPRWHDGTLWVSDTQGGRLWSDADGTWSATPTPSMSNGLWVLPDGRLVGAIMDEQRIGVWTGSDWRTHADLAPLGVGLLGDLVGDVDGNLYVDDVAFAAARGEAVRPGRIILVRADGSAVVAAEGVEFPNGLALIDGGTTLVVAETSRQRITAFDVRSDGTLADPRTYADVAAVVGPDARPDGIWAVGDDLWVATTTGQVVARFRGGELVGTVDVSPGYPVACCAGGGDSILVTVAQTDGAPLLDALARKAVTSEVLLVEPPPPG